MLKVRCRSCGKEIEAHSHRTRSCGCPNMLTITGDVVTAVDLNRVLMVHSGKEKPEGLSSQDLEWQEQRRKRKVRRLDFEVR